MRNLKTSTLHGRKRQNRTCHDHCTVATTGYTRCDNSDCCCVCFSQARLLSHLWAYRDEDASSSVLSPNQAGLHLRNRDNGQRLVEMPGTWDFKAKILAAIVRPDELLQVSLTGCGRAIVGGTYQREGLRDRRMLNRQPLQSWVVENRK